MLSNHLRGSSALSSPNNHANNAYRTCSVDYAIGSSCESLDTLVRRADQALYRAKAAGRNRIEPQSNS